MMVLQRLNLKHGQQTVRRRSKCGCNCVETKWPYSFFPPKRPFLNCKSNEILTMYMQLIDLVLVMKRLFFQEILIVQGDQVVSLVDPSKWRCLGYCLIQNVDLIISI